MRGDGQGVSVLTDEALVGSRPGLQTSTNGLKGMEESAQTAAGWSLLLPGKNVAPGDGREALTGANGLAVEATGERRAMEAFGKSL